MVRELLRARCGALLDKIFHDISEKNTCFQTAEVELTQEELESLISELNFVAAKYAKLSARTRQVVPAQGRRSVGWFLGVTPYVTDWRNV